MQKSAIRSARRTIRRTLRAELRSRSAATRLAASCRRRPRSLATVAIAAGVDRESAAELADGLRSVAARLDVKPAETARTRRTVAGGRADRTRNVGHWTLAQVALLVSSYRPRKANRIAAAARLTAFTAAA
ncbi:hypothetical protein [Streptomyces sp. NPDC003015]